MKVGYARVSTRRQHLDLQVRALEKAGCDIIVAEKVSGASTRKTGLAAALALCGEGDTLVVWKLDRLGRDLFALLRLLKLLEARGSTLHVISGGGAAIDITTPEGRTLYAVLAIFADLEHVFGSDRTAAGLSAARARRGGAGSRKAHRRRASRRSLRTVARQVSLAGAFSRATGGG
jgi:Enterobacteriaceae phage serine recombinase